MKPSIERARDLRRKMTHAETIFWSRVRNRGLGGLKIKRQVPIGKYVVDFCVEDAKLAIEIDGEQHGFDRNVGHDAARDAFLRGDGYMVIRFWNTQIYKNLIDVLDQVLYVAVERMKQMEIEDPSPGIAAQFRPLPRER